jgi:hypothetical protein
MKTPLIAISLSFLVATFPICAQSVSGPTNPADYEELPELKASEILRPEILNGPHHKVQEPVPTYSGSNHFSIDSDFGAFEAEGNEMLIRRINEINAISELRDVSRTEQYKNALVKAAASTLTAAKSIVTDPMNTVANVPKGLMKFMGRARESVKGIGKKDESSAAEGSKAQQLIGFSDTKRKVAISLGVDPYSTNAVLQKELDRISWASFAGGLTFQVATMPIGGGAGAALTATGLTKTFEEVVREKSPTDLKIMNRKILVEMGASAADAEAFLNNAAFSPTAETAFALNLKSLDGVANRGAFVRLAAKTSSDETDAIFCVETAALMGNLHKGGKPLARIALIGDFPICIAKDGTVVVALQWDYAAWTAGAERFARSVKSHGKEKSTYLVALSGVLSPRLQQELESRGFHVQDRLTPGPLR